MTEGRKLTQMEWGMRITGWAAVVFLAATGALAAIGVLR
jgi:hypothetical protein